MSNSAFRFGRSKKYTPGRQPRSRAPRLSFKKKSETIMGQLRIVAEDPPEEMSCYHPLWWTQYASPAACAIRPPDLNELLGNKRLEHRPMIHIDFGAFNYEAPEPNFTPLVSR